MHFRKKLIEVAMSSDNDNVVNALVAEYLSKVSPGIAKKFKVTF